MDKIFSFFFQFIDGYYISERDSRYYHDYYNSLSK